MSFMNVATLLGGLAFFLFGMNTMGNALEKSAGNQLKTILGKLTSNKFKGFILGLLVTAIIQSSSATTVMVVGFVNSGVMQLAQAVGVIMGANLGTSVTSWILSLTGIESDNFWVSLCKPETFTPVLALIGVILNMFSKKAKHKDIGVILLGFSVLMFGMETMSDAVKPLTELEGFKNALVMFSNPVLGMIMGTVVTAVVQSSSASVGILQALTLTGSINYMTAVPIIMGQNIGTCVSALLASFGASKNAKRVAMVHILFNSIGSVICLTGWLIADAIFNFAFTDTSVEPFTIAILHSIFNVTTTIMLFPFSKLLEKLVKLIIRDAKDTEESVVLLDERLMTVPSFAVAKAEDVTSEMATLAKRSVKIASSLLERYDEKTALLVEEMESTIDRYEDELGTYLVKLSKKEIGENDTKKISKLLHTISDFERIGDHADNILATAKEMHEKKVSFSDEAKEEIDNLTDAIAEILSITVKAFKNDDIELAEIVEPLEEVIDEIIDHVKSRHVERLTKGNCTIELGFILTDVITNFERISDHCSNIAVAVIEAQREMFDAHEYLSNVKKDPSGKYYEYFEKYKKQYSI